MKPHNAVTRGKDAHARPCALLLLLRHNRQRAYVQIPRNTHFELLKTHNTMFEYTYTFELCNTHIEHCI